MSSNTDAGTFLTFFLTARGHGALGRADLKPVLNAGPFEAGLKTRSASFVDPDVVTWNEHFQEDIHAMLLIADDHEVVRNTKRAAVLSLIRHLMARRGITHGQRVVSPNTPDLASAHEGVLCAPARAQAI